MDLPRNNNHMRWMLKVNWGPLGGFWKIQNKRFGLPGRLSRPLMPHDSP